ncbi:peptidoglycan-binding protein, partial [Streptomyces albogriseolus]|uniref:peptidoglycan-binding protein n=1 Tax=Streptomyces albogriseolus TaxID=1887 RepID=UPI0033A71832
AGPGPGGARERPLPRAGKRPRRSPAHRAALVVAAVTSAALGSHPVPAVAAQDTRVSAGQGVPADQESGGGQGAPGPLFGSDGRTGPALPPGAPETIPAISRTDIVRRAASWVSQKVPYSVSSYWSDGYRQDCSGYVSMAWRLPGNEWTGSLAQYAEKITKAELRPGDILLFHNASDPYNGSHVVIFGGWANSARTQYVAYEQTPPHTRRTTTPYAYWNNSARYVPYRYKGVTDGAAGAVASVRPALPAEPPVADSPPVAAGADAVEPGVGELAPAVPDGPRGTDAGERAAGVAPTRRGIAVDGAPGLSAGRSGGAPDVSNGGSASAPAGLLAAPASPGVPGCPGRAPFRPGAENEHVTRLDRNLVTKGLGRHHTQGPGPRRGEEDRRNVADFQRAQGRRGRTADGVPGPETWRRLFT